MNPPGSVPPHRYDLELRRPDGELLARHRVDRAYAQPLLEDAVLTAQRRNVVGLDPAAIRVDFEPVPTAPGEPIETLRVHVGEQNGAVNRTPALTLEYSTNVFVKDTRDLAVARLLEEGRLHAGSEYVATLLAGPAEDDGASRKSGGAGGALDDVEVVVAEPPLPAMEGRLEEWTARARLLNPEAQRDGDLHVFIHRSAFDLALRHSRSGGKSESGSMLSGLLYRQQSPSPELFSVIDAAFEARHARGAEFSLELTTETYVYVEKQLAARRRRLSRPQETLLGTAHGHPFLPALAKDGQPLCPSCHKRATCALHSAFFSEDDVRFHSSLFRKRIYAVGLVWGLSPRMDDVLRVYGFRRGALEERAIWLLDD